MKIIKPVTITDAVFTSSSRAEDDYAAWSSGTAYVVGNRCIRTTTHRIYECLVNNTNFTPETNTSGLTPKWLDIGPTNKWAMMDAQWGTQTSKTESLQVVLTPGAAIDSLALLNLVASSGSILVTSGGLPVYYADLALEGRFGVYDWFTYFYEPISYATDVVNLDIPAYIDAVVTVSLTYPAGTVLIGNLIMGLQYDMGGTQYGATAGIIDYSTKTTDAFGFTTITPRKYSKRMAANLEIPSSRIDDILNTLALYRSTSLVWIGADDLYSALMVYGYYKDFEINIAYPELSFCSITIEGLT